MAKKGQKFCRYSLEFKEKAVQMYIEGMGYKTVAKELGIPSHKQVRDWVKKYKNGDSLDDNRGKRQKNSSFIGRPRTRFKTIEEERDYLKAQVEYLKKRNPNLHGEGSFQK